MSSTSLVVSTGARNRRSCSFVVTTSIVSPKLATRYVTSVVGAIGVPVKRLEKPTLELTLRSVVSQRGRSVACTQGVPHLASVAGGEEISPVLPSGGVEIQLLGCCSRSSR